jgi:serine/threonine protein kinase/formylglycine-generating enzyme required for sulfatase activity
MGMVFKAEDSGLQRLVALKAMLPSVADTPSARERFFREARAAAALKHPHIVTVHQVGEERGAPFLAMEFLEGESLEERLKREPGGATPGALPLPDVIRIGREIAEGLTAAHAKGLIHRDIKPANIWLETTHHTPLANSKTLDFGLARDLADQTHLTQQGVILGTPAYMAPEQAGGKPVDHRCDLFSLGCVLYRMATGRTPFKGNDTIAVLSAIALETPPAPAKLNPDVPQDLSKLIMTLLSKKAEDRPFSANEVAKALKEMERDGDDKTLQIVARRPPTSIGKGKGEKTPALPKAITGRKKWRLVGVGGGVAIVLVVALSLFWRSPHGRVKIDSDDPSVEIVFDKTGPTLKGTDKKPISLRAGEHDILVKRGDFSFEIDRILVERGKTITLKFELFLGKMHLVQDGETILSRDIPLPKTFTNSLGMEFVLVPRGKSWLGGFYGKPGDKEVEVMHDFYLGKYEVTQEEWEKVTGTNTSMFSRTGRGKDLVEKVSDDDLKRFPVEQVSWDAAQDFIKRLNKQSKETGWGYRLPKEAEWEYACRGGPTDKLESSFDYYFEKPIRKLLPEQANVRSKSTRKVGSYKPNRLGLYDMHGNVWEWCEDLFDPTDAKKANFRVERGGGWDLTDAHCRAAYRGALRSSTAYGYNGLRVARVPAGKDIAKVIAIDEKKSTN